ncbi:ABC transporter permease [Neobacillus sp. PS3-40]|uniref:ABC transporter permease n=1 Tax=Neobacillus sp. PS3-40 TaxID=3070679 RepID=UPI0027DED2AD|nr:ABC transporter permease [Neobacillus sp. PS3-40]WML43299.1 ABC transporter permease [Neobacillus sp. PS3-40]
MFDDKKLWKDRAGKRAKDLGRYLRYIFNSHLVIVLLFLIGAGAFYYQQWIKTLPLGFPSEIVMAIFLGLFLTYSPVYNFLLEADQVFLLPLEDRLQRYFFRSGVISLIFQGYILLLVLAILMPLYAHVSGTGFRTFIPFLIALLMIKSWNLASNWRMHYFHSGHSTDWVIRFLLNGLLTYSLFKHVNLWLLLLIVAAMVIYYRSLYARTRNTGLKWDLLIDQEEKRMIAFYRLANLFTDVPKLKDSVKRRIWLDFLLNRISFTQEKTFLYLFSRTFLRSGDYLGLFIRLTVIGSVGLYFISFGFGQILLAVLFLYLTGFQLLPLWNHHQNKLWLDLYPVSIRFKSWAFHSLLMIILLTQVLLFALIIFIKGEVLIAVLELLAGIGFSYIFVFMYSKSRLKG